MTKAKQQKVYVSWAIRRDLPACATIDAGRPGAWGLERFAAELERRSTIGYVARDARTERIVGFAVVELVGDGAKSLEVLRASVASDAPAGTATALGERIAKKCRDFHRMLVVATPTRFRWIATADPQWATWDVRALCAGDTPPLPVLADALEEAGCRDEFLLGMFRADGAEGAAVYELVRATLAGDRP